MDGKRLKFEGLEEDEADDLKSSIDMLMSQMKDLNMRKSKSRSTQNVMSKIKTET